MDNKNIEIKSNNYTVDINNNKYELYINNIDTHTLLLNKQGYEVTNRYGKLSLRGKNYKRNIRIERQYGEEYSIERIQQRIQVEYPDPVPIDENEFYKYKNISSKKKEQ